MTRIREEEEVYTCNSLTNYCRLFARNSITYVVHIKEKNSRQVHRTKQERHQSINQQNTVIITNTRQPRKKTTGTEFQTNIPDTQPVGSRTFRKPVLCRIHI